MIEETNGGQLISQELEDQIVRELEGKAFVFVCQDSKLPCPDVLAGEECYGHKTQFISNNIQQHLLPGFLENVLKSVVRGMVEDGIIEEVESDEDEELSTDE